MNMITKEVHAVVTSCIEVEKWAALSVMCG